MKTPEETIGNVPVAMRPDGQESTWRPGTLIGERMVKALDAAGYVIVRKEAVDALARGEIDLAHKILAKP